MKIGCVIQGDIRRGTSQVLQEMCQKFDLTILSTWSEDVYKIPSGDYLLVTSNKPPVPGLSNRNYQRLSTARGIQAAKEAGCDYVLKWRTDMLPMKLDVNQFLNWSNYSVPKGMKSRLVMPAFRNLSVVVDWFSSIPDLFTFGHIDEMEILWGDSEFDYSLKMNLPDEMFNESKKLLLNLTNLENLYCSESELYAIFRSRLQKKLGVQLDHRSIALDYFRLFDYHRLGIFWFAKESGFRSIGQAWEHPWWTEKNWENGGARISQSGYPVSGILGNVLKVFSPIRVLIDQYRQSILWSLRK